MARIENWNPPVVNYHKAIYSWDVDYASKVHEGDYAAGYPARPWVDNALAQIDVEKDFWANYQRTEDLNDAFAHVVDVISEQSLHEITNPVYDWPRETRRKSGELAGKVRDAYDTGDLYESQSVELEE